MGAERDAREVACVPQSSVRPRYFPWEGTRGACAGERGMELNDLTGTVIGAAIEVHRELGPGSLESAYEACLYYEITERGLKVLRQLQLPLTYKGIHLDVGYRVDLLVEDAVIVEIKAVDKLERVHEAQVLSYLRLSKCRLGLLINFNVPVLKHGIKRIVYGTITAPSDGARDPWMNPPQTSQM